MFIQMLFIRSMIFLQSLEVTDVTGLMSAKELTVNGLLLIAIIMLWRRMIAAEEKNETVRKETEEKLQAIRTQRDTDNQKYIDLLITTTKIIDENTSMYKKLEKILDK